jgi:hypothetical protein
MSTEVLTKKEGNSGPCYMCGKTMFCRMKKDEKYGDKLQWQNEDGKSHWLPNKEGCRNADGSSPKKGNYVAQATKMDLSNFKPELVTETEHEVWKGIVGKVAEYALLSEKRLQEFSEITNPALKGMITKTAFEVLNQINERKSRA